MGKTRFVEKEVDYIKIWGTYETQTDKAILIDHDTAGKVWIPKSLVQFGPSSIDADVGERVDLNVIEWFVEKNDL